jgi:hypothetical protein
MLVMSVVLVFAAIAAAIGFVRLYRQGYMCWGTRNNYRKVYRRDEPTKFWAAFSLNLLVLTAMLVGALLIVLKYPQ